MKKININSLNYIPTMIVSKFSSKIANNLIKMKGGQIAHHGIQRSGTNFLSQSLCRCGLQPINFYDEKRNTPRHKHFRWYANKVAIPDILVDQYGNSLMVSNIELLNEFACYPDTTIHLVIKKNKLSWLASIVNWGIRCNWFDTKESALNYLNVLGEDYDSYYSFWENLESDSPMQVGVISFEEVRKDFNILKNKIIEFGIIPKCGNFSGIINEVPMSPRTRVEMITKEDIEKSLTSL